MSKNIFQQYGAYYDLLYRDKDYAGEVDYIVSLLHRSSPRAHQILEFGSGTGRHGRLLAQRGFDVLGVEGSEAMVAEAKRNSNGFHPLTKGRFDCRRGDIRSVVLDRQFDSVLALFHVVSYQTTNHGLLRTFSNAARHLRSGGVFLFDVWHGPAVLTERPATRVKRVEDENTMLTRIAEPKLDTNAAIVTVHYTMISQAKADSQINTFTEEHRMRYLFPTEIDLLAQQTGFEVEHSEEFLTGKPPAEGTWGVAYLLRKKA